MEEQICGSCGGVMVWVPNIRKMICMRCHNPTETEKEGDDYFL